jgi:hypothetical protein
MKILKDWFTGIDGTTYDVGRFLWFVGVWVFLFSTIYALSKGQTWNAIEYGTGLGLVLAGGGAALGLKAHTEPTKKE